MDNSTPNTLIENTVLGSKFVDPEYLFNNSLVYLKYIFSAKTLWGFYAFLSFLAIIFITIIIYCTIRMFEIRKKEHTHLHHEIAEYAHRQALREK